MAGKDNTTRIEILENQAANIAARLDVHEVQLKGISEILKKCAEASEGHTSQLTVIEHKILALVDFKALTGAVALMEKELALVKKDLEGLASWKEDLRKEREEKSRRAWAFGPSVTAAIISAIVALAGIAINYYLGRIR
jgi:chromosome segregation ATPase